MPHDCSGGLGGGGDDRISEALDTLKGRRCIAMWGALVGKQTKKGNLRKVSLGRLGGLGQLSI